MEIYRGMPTFPGIAIGKIHYYPKDEGRRSRYTTEDVKRELKLFHTARRRVLEGLREDYEAGREPGEAQACLDMARILDGGSYVRAVESMIRKEKVSAFYGVMTTKEELLDTFRKLEDPGIRRYMDLVAAVSQRLLKVLGRMTPRISLGDEPVILAADGLSPEEIMEMNKEKLLAVVTKSGSEISHVSILARTMGIPSVVGISICEFWEGCQAIVDGYTGCLYLNPSGEVKREYEIRQKADIQEKEELLKLRDYEDRTSDGKEVKIYANISSLEDLSSAVYYGAAGIGLLRSEFQYLGKENPPREKDLFLAYKRLGEVMKGRLGVIRAADLGEDKKAEYLGLFEEENPLMGNRGIRLLLDKSSLLKDQLRAIYRASIYGQLAVLYPMVSSMEEVEEALKLEEEVKRELQAEEIPFQRVLTGVMVETPAAVMISGQLAKKVDFLSLGTNDLTQYTLAMDRQNPALRKRYNDHHPAVLAMIKMTVEAGHREGKAVGICGELAADTGMTGELLAMGVDFLSVVPACILPVRKVLRTTNLKK